MIQLMKGKMTYECFQKNRTHNVLTEALKDSLNKLDSALGNSVSKLSKSVDEKIDKLNSAHTSGQPEDLNRERQEALWSNGLVVKVLDSQSRSPMLKTTG